MNNYVIKKIDNNLFDYVVTIKNYLIPTSYILEKIIFPQKNGKVLIDNRLRGGLSTSQFFEVQIEDYTINSKTIKEICKYQLDQDIYNYTLINQADNLKLISNSYMLESEKKQLLDEINNL